MRQKRLLPFLLCAPLALAACGGEPANSGANANGNAPTANASPAAATQPQATPRQQEVTATVEEATLAAGGSGEASITLDIREGYHVNANPASDRFYIPTEVRAEPQDGLTPGKPVYPKGVSRKFEFADAPLSVYDGRAVIKLPLRADKSMSKGRHTLRAKIRVQPCNDEACLPPREIDAAIPVTIN
jgi:DsbC/DsbD-like thiol-disulfide interchange protein